MVAAPTFTTRAIALTLGDPHPGLLRGADRLLQRALRLPLARRAFRRLVDLHVPGTTRHLVARKTWFATSAREWLTATPDATVFVLGAGLDDLGVQLLAEFPRADVHEFDRPPAMARKRTAWPDGPHFHDTDLAAPDLRFPASERPLLVLAEGLFMYLDDAALDAVLTALRAAAPGAVTLLFSCLDRDALDDPRRPIARLARRLERRGEPFRWTPGQSARDAWLAAHGFRRRGEPQTPTTYGECFVTAELSQS